MRHLQFWEQIISTLLVLLFLVFSISAQRDTTLLELNRLQWDDIAEVAQRDLGTTIISGSRFERKVADLPFTIHVVTAREIRDKGYLTLVDVLESVPGIRTSKVGSAQEGETFMMRGLLGNAYTKILINDVPVRPFVTSGMPIGAQLPIRQAERIEIIYGPAATLYGADASAGIINIILKESERPTFAQADLGIGEKGLLNLDMMFGGKIGRGQDVLKFKVFGNYLTQQDKKVVYDRDNLYNPDFYNNALNQPPLSYLSIPNYRGTAGEPLIGDLPHQSNLLGLDLNYRNFSFGGRYMYRRDHSSIGLSPFAVSYSNPLNFIGETIQNYSVMFRKRWNKWSLNSAVAALLYNTDSRNSHTYVIPSFQVALRRIVEDNAPIPARDSLYALVNDAYFSGIRFSRSSSREFSWETIASYTLNDQVSISSGLNLQLAEGSPMVQYQRNPAFFSNDPPQDPDLEIAEVSFWEVSAFFELYYNSKRLNAILGAQILKRDDDYLDDNPTNLNPRLAVQYKFNENLSARTSYATAFRFPSPFFQSTTVRIENSVDRIVFGQSNLATEETRAFEIGARWQQDDLFSADLSAFYNRSSELINFAVDPNMQALSLGYFNDRDSETELVGVQLMLDAQDFIPEFNFGSSLSLAFFEGKEVLKAFSLEDSARVVRELDGLRAQPGFLAKWQWAFWPDRKFNVYIDHLYASRALTRNSVRFQTLRPMDDTDMLFNDGYYIMDIRFGYNVNNHLRATLIVTNVFDSEYAGIDATLDTDALRYNPQPTRMFRLGLSYRLTNE